MTKWAALVEDNKLNKQQPFVLQTISQFEDICMANCVGVVVFKIYKPVCWAWVAIGNS